LRAHKLSYSRKLHERLEMLKPMLGAGIPIVGERLEKKKGLFNPPNNLKGEENSLKGRKGKNRFNYDQESEYNFYVLPPPTMPEKDPVEEESSGEELPEEDFFELE